MSKGTFQAAADGIDDDVLAIGIFQHRGTQKNAMIDASLGGLAGSILGDVVGHGAGELISDLGTAAGSTAGIAHARNSGGIDGVLRWLIAVSPTRVYVLVPDDAVPSTKTQTTELRRGQDQIVQTIDRQHLEVTVKARATSRLLTLADLETGATLELEGLRGMPGAGDVVHELVKHHDDEPA